jgi:hypothetical protein
MRILRLVLPAVALCCLGMAERPPTVIVRFYAEANARDTDTFSTPIKIGNPPHDAFLEKIAAVHERQITAVYPFRAPDGTWGCSFKLDHDGRLGLELISTSRRGAILVGFIGTKRGNHRVVDMVIDRPVLDGVITMPHGLTELEIAVLTKQFRVLGNGGVAPKLKRTPWNWNPFQKKEAVPELAPRGNDQ